jgi:hypothetical protein
VTEILASKKQKSFTEKNEARIGGGSSLRFLMCGSAREIRCETGAVALL